MNTNVEHIEVTEELIEIATLSDLEELEFLYEDFLSNLQEQDYLRD